MKEDPPTRATKPAKLRLDELLVRQGWCATRSQAKALLLAGKVRHGTEICDKPGRVVPEDFALTLLSGPKYVSRGGEKLAGFLGAYAIHPEGWTVLDVGASTGGFTDCLLQQGAVHATCVDVGYGQLHAKLRNDPRVTNLERFHARDLDQATLPFPCYDLVVMDLSFISLRKVLPGAWRRVRVGGQLVALVKPQFEATKAEADKGAGIIRDAEIHQRVLREIRAFSGLEMPGAVETGCLPSPIQGADGNQEFLLGWKKQDSPLQK